MKRTCLYEHHKALGARMAEFGGFEMPIVYSSIPEEHHAVRKQAGVFDVSHMGEIMVMGRDTMPFLEKMFSNEITSKPAGKIVYGMFLEEDGKVVDDLLIYKTGDSECLLVVNASNTAKDYQWLLDHAEGYDVDIEDRSPETSLLALQGPDSERVMRDVLGADLGDLEGYSFRDIKLDRKDALVSRTGYTGEDGFELYSSADAIVEIWERLMAAGVAPCGLGARDTLRFEAGLPLYGHEIGGDITPLEAGLRMFVKLDKAADFLGRDKLRRDLENGLRRKVVGIELTERAIPRQGYEVLHKGEKAGVITTGYLSLTLEKPIAMALVDSDYAAPGTEIEVAIRRKTFPGFVRDKRFLKG